MCPGRIVISISPVITQAFDKIIEALYPIFSIKGVDVRSIRSCSPKLNVIRIVI